MVLERDSSILGYPGEISKALVADHHDVCKYDGPQDPNYVTVRNVLKTLVSKIIAKDNAKRPDLSNRRASLNLKTLLGISELPGQDYIFFRDQWTQGTNDWIFHEKAFLKWRDASEPTHHLLWLSGGAATGKSVMSSFIVNKLVEDGLRCQYFFIRFGDRKKRSLSLLLRSLTYQLALSLPGFLQKVAQLVDEAIDFETADPRIIWDRVFKSILFTWEEKQPLYWVIDGLDEAEDPRAVMKLLSDISSSSIPIRLLFTSRRVSELTTAIEKVPADFSSGTISIEGHVEDLYRHIRQELVVSGSAEFKGDVERRIVELSQNNFLVGMGCDALLVNPRLIRYAVGTSCSGKSKPVLHSCRRGPCSSRIPRGHGGAVQPDGIVYREYPNPQRPVSGNKNPPMCPLLVESPESRRALTGTRRGRIRDAGPPASYNGSLWWLRGCRQRGQRLHDPQNRTRLSPRNPW